MINDNLLTSDLLNKEAITGEVFKGGKQTYYAYGQNQRFSGSDASEYLTPENIQAGIGLTTAVASGIAQNRSGQVCKKPLIRENITNHKKWQDYRACLDREEKRRQDEIALEEAKARAKQAEALANRSAVDLTTIDDKILGMPKGVAIGVGVALVAVLGFVVYKVVKRK
jgi:hypothetical protein